MFLLFSIILGFFYFILASSCLLCVVPVSQIIFQALLPSGCQQWSTNVLAASKQRFAFCSSLAVYIYSFEDFALRQVIAGHDKTIQALAWCPFDPNIIATCGAEGKLSVWDLNTETEVSNDQLSFPYPIRQKLSDYSHLCLDLVT